MTLLVVSSLSIPLMGILTIKEFVHGDADKNTLLKALKNSVYIVAALLLLFILFGGMLFDFQGLKDERVFGKEQKWLLDAIFADRVRMLRLDALRSLIFILIAAG